LSEIGLRHEQVLSTLFITRFASGTPNIVLSLLLIEISKTFQTSVGVAGQMGTAYSIMGVLAAITMGALSVRFDHKLLLLIGFALFTISALGCGVTPTLLIMTIFYSLSGLAISVINPMTSSLVAEYFSIEKRNAIIGWLVAGGSASYIIGAQIITRIADIGGWRLAFLLFVLPVSLIGLIMVKTLVPDVDSTSYMDVSYLDGFRTLFSNPSAFYCLVGSALKSVSFQVILLYSPSFLREVFSLRIDLAAVIMTVAALFFTFGSLVAGRISTRFGRKNTNVTTVFIASMASIIYTTSVNLELCILLNFIAAWFFGMSMSSGESLNLEQLPKYRGTMMSLSNAVGSMGGAFGAALGGLIIINKGYKLLGLSLGVFGIASSIIIHTLTTDLKNQSTG
jgi:predicted MFS family arabinose efflux permease